MTLVAGFSSRAVPPDRIVELKEGDEIFLPAGQGTWQAISENPRTVEAKGVAGGEIHLKARGRGRALVLVENRKIGRLYVWLALVEEQPAEKLKLESLPCPCSRPDPEEPPICVITGRVCLEELRRALAGSGMTNDDLWVRYELKGVQTLLAQMEQALSRAGFSGVEAMFAGGNLRIEGRVRDEQQRSRLIFDLYRLMVGRLVLEDRLRIGESEPASGIE